ncbi:MAG: GDP-mannose 4,6-dehydratase [Candidatus Aenigmarchaeota archaeon]|nr:GDP-mannose 4,6-dehydratase [Candidatus Aenigmarchaeota archaeon]MDI6722364.1 GDP-mannose 4,6-dehydratase [Candidatus Aenigmarchaeota archaeon]
MRALITGISGFVGSHLAEHLLSKNYEVYGSIRWRSRLDNIEHIKNKITLIETDIRDAHSVDRLIRDTEPDVIFHLAAQSFVPASWNAPQDTIYTNVIGTVNLLESIRTSKIDPRIHIAGSSEEYGLVLPDEVPIKEANPLRPLSPYGVSKVAEDMLGYQYFKSYSLKIIITRAFNHSGPRRGDVFVESNFAKQIAEIEKGANPVIHVGNLNAQRDFSDVRDIIRAYLLSLEKCKFGEVYNICSEKTVKICDMLNILLSKTESDIEVRTDPSRLRPSDVEILLGDCEKFRKQTGWRPEIPFEKTVEDLLNYWRQKV